MRGRTIQNLNLKQLYQILYKSVLMGQNQSKTTIKQGWNQKFGKIHLINQQSDASQIEMKVSLQYKPLQREFEYWQDMRNILMQDSYIKQLIVLPTSVDYQKCLICTEQNEKSRLKLCYKKFNLTLSQEIKNRKQSKDYFMENELWYLLLILLKVAAYFQQKSSYLGNLHPSNVIITDNNIQVFTIFSSPLELENIERIRSSRYEDAFIAPQQMNILSLEEVTQIELNPNKIDLFNIGLIMLSAITFKDCYFLYNRNKFSSNEQKFNAYKQQLSCRQSGKFSAPLCHLVQQFLIIDPNLRKSPVHFYSQLRRYENQIVSLQQFPIENLLNSQQSPEVVNYLQKASPNTKETKYLSLSAKNSLRGSKKAIQSELKPKDVVYHPKKINRRLFN